MWSSVIGSPNEVGGEIPSVLMKGLVLHLACVVLGQFGSVGTCVYIVWSLFRFGL